MPATTRRQSRRKSWTRSRPPTRASRSATATTTSTKRVEQRFAELFEREVAVFLVPTGTAANALALAHLAPPWGAVLCHAEAHIATDECGAPEFFGGGIKLVGLPGEGCKIAPGTLEAALAEGQWGGPHHVSPAVLSLSQATEAGTIYRPTRSGAWPRSRMRAA